MQALGSEEAGLARLALRALANPSLLLLRNFQGRGAVWIRLTGLSDSVRGVDVQARPGCGSRTASESPAWGGTNKGGTDTSAPAASRNVSDSNVRVPKLRDRLFRGSRIRGGPHMPVPMGMLCSESASYGPAICTYGTTRISVGAANPRPFVRPIRT